MKLSELSALVGGQLLGQDCFFHAVNTDSRSVAPGELFIALSGDRFDGHDFIEQARSKGAAGALVSRFVSTSLPMVRVVDVCEAFGKLAAAHRRQYRDIDLIALTGSCGKTTTKAMLHSILSECGETLASIKSFNNAIGVPLTLLNLTAQHRYAVVEMGANHPGEIAYLTQLAQPTVALITNVAPAHLEGFGSLEGVMRAKSEIFSTLTHEGTAVINADDAFADQWKASLDNVRCISFGLQHPADFSAKEMSTDDQGCYRFILCSQQGDIAIQLPLLGKHNVLNSLAAAAAASAVGASLEAIKAGLEKSSLSIPGRLVVNQGRSNTRVIDDTYNANPASVTAALHVLAHYTGDRVLVLGDMKELGDGADVYHRQIGQLAKELGIEHVYTCGDLAQFTSEAFGPNACHFANQQDLSDALQKIIKPGMTFLVKGSRSSRMENIVSILNRLSK